LIPLLKKSDLADQFEDEVIIPDKYVFKNFKKRIVYDIVIEDDNDFNLVMDQLRFYMVKELPYEVYDYVAKNKPDLSNFKDFFFEELTLLKNIEKNYPDNRSILKGYLNLIKYLYENGYRFSKHCCDTAVCSGFKSKRPGDNESIKYLNCLKYLYNKGYQISSTTCSAAALGNNLDCLMFLHNIKCKWDSDTCFFASCSGVDCLKYAIENGCPYDKRNCIYKAKQNNHMDIVKYLQSI
jgi:hypothetical protein